MPEPREEMKGILLHIGKKCPKGTEEMAGGIHLGKGIWALKCKIIRKGKSCQS
jgi:hypothetical protein